MLTFADTGVIKNRQHKASLSFTTVFIDCCFWFLGSKAFTHMRSDRMNPEEVLFWSLRPPISLHYLPFLIVQAHRAANSWSQVSTLPESLLDVFRAPTVISGRMYDGEYAEFSWLCDIIKFYIIPQIPVYRMSADITV